MAPSVFSRVGDMSAVIRQPEGEEERQEALRALLSCPTWVLLWVLWVLWVPRAGYCSDRVWRFKHTPGTANAFTPSFLAPSQTSPTNAVTLD